MDDDQHANDNDVVEGNDPVEQPQAEDTAVAAPSSIDQVKQEAIEALVPILDSIEAEPERKFELIMTALRVNFNEDLLRKALDSAKAIDDPTAKAEALIDVINEANYQEQ